MTKEEFDVGIKTMVQNTLMKQVDTFTKPFTSFVRHPDNEDELRFVTEVVTAALDSLNTLTTEAWKKIDAALTPEHFKEYMNKMNSSGGTNGK